MAIKELKSIKFPGLDDVYVIPEGGDGTISIDLAGANEGEANPVNADTLGGKTEDKLNVADSAKFGGQLPNYYATAEQLNTVNNNIHNNLYCIETNSNAGTTMSFKLYRDNVGGRLNMFAYGSNNGSPMYGMVSINIYTTINTDPNYLSCKTSFVLTDQSAGTSSNKTVNVAWDGATDPITVTLSNFANWANLHIISNLRLEQ